jgi:uncharacterized RDD family membrane protein YckC
MVAQPIPNDDDFTVTLRSPDGAILELPVAGPAVRMAAYIIDFAVFLAVLVVFTSALALAAPAVAFMKAHVAEWVERTSVADPNAAAALAGLLVPLFILMYLWDLLYFSAWEWSTRGRTPGKYLCKLRVIGADGQPVDLKASIVRNVLRIVDLLPGAYMTGLASMVTTARGQRLGDYVANTLVIRIDRIAMPEHLELPPNLEPLRLSREQMSRLGDAELTLARSTLRRLKVTPGERGRSLVARAADVLAVRLRVEQPSPQEAERFLQQVLVTAQYTMR